MGDIPYTVVPPPSKYNVGVFLLNFNSRKDGRTMKEAFEYDFDWVIPSHVLTYSDLIHYLMSLR